MAWLQLGTDDVIQREPQRLTLTTLMLPCQVLAEILQQRARVYDPHAAARRDFVRCAVSPALPF